MKDYKHQREKFMRALFDLNITAEERIAISELAQEMTAAYSEELIERMIKSHEKSFSRELRKNLRINL